MEYFKGRPKFLKDGEEKGTSPVDCIFLVFERGQTERRFQANQGPDLVGLDENEEGIKGFDIDGIRFRIVYGRKVSRRRRGRDLRLEVFTEHRWRAMHMTLALFLTDFFCENEDILYPPEQGFKGGQMHIEALEVARRQGYKQAREWSRQQARRDT